jgi:hypothetical protein
MKIENIKDKTFFNTLRELSRLYFSYIKPNDDPYFSAPKFELEPFESEFNKLKDINLDIPWGGKQYKKGHLAIIINGKKDINPWYNGNLDSESLLEPIKNIYDYLNSIGKDSLLEEDLKFILNAKQIINYCDLHFKKPQTGTKEHKFISMNEMGDFFYQGKKIQFKGNKSYHYLLLDCLLNHSGMTNFCSYDDLIQYFKSNEKKNPNKKTIVNAVKEFFYRVKVDNKPIKKLLPDKKTFLIETKYGTGLKLNNPSVD